MERKTAEISPELLRAQREICEKIKEYWKTFNCFIINYCNSFNFYVYINN